MKHIGHYIIGSVLKGRYIFVTNGQAFGVTWPRRVMSYGAACVIIL